MPSSSIVLRFLRKNCESSLDDIVQIEKLANGLYRLKYTYGFTHVKSKSFCLTLDDRTLFWWVRVLLRLVEKDAEPFESIQIDLPMLPSVLIDVKTLDDSYHTILDAIEFHLDNWPVSEDEDMPPLLPIELPSTTSEPRFVSAYGRALMRVD